MLALTSLHSSKRVCLSSARRLLSSAPELPESSAVQEHFRKYVNAGLDKPPTPPPGMPAYPPPTNPISANKDTGNIKVIQPPPHRLHVHSTRNNTITSFTRPDGGVIAWFSGGSCGFKKGNRASYEAGYQCAVRMFQRIEKEMEATGPIGVDLFFKGFGQGRDALQRALLTSEGENVRPLVKSVTDRTAIKIGGTRAQKKRRL